MKRNDQRPIVVTIKSRAVKPEYKEARDRANLNRELRLVAKESPQIVQMPHGYARDDMGAYPYAVRVLTLAGEMPHVAKMPLEIIKLANGLLKRMRLPQIDDRADWRV